MIKTKEQIKKIKIAGKILASIAKKLKEVIKEGVSLKELDYLAKNLIEEAGATPAFLGYKPFGAKKPYLASICTSINETIVHGIPTDYRLKSGDLLKLDFGVDYESHIADAAFSVGIGNVSAEVKKIIEVTKNALHVGIKECKPGKTIGDIGWAINNYVTKNGFKVVKGLTGHGVGLKLHEEPIIFNEGQKNTGLRLKPGMVLAIEPMTSAGGPYISQKQDDSYITRDKSLSAHFEHTILITNGSPEILTE